MQPPSQDPHGDLPQCLPLQPGQGTECGLSSGVLKPGPGHCHAQRGRRPLPLLSRLPAGVDGGSSLDGLRGAGWCRASSGEDGPWS